MDKERYKFLNYEITNDPSFMDEQNTMTPELREIQESLFLEIFEGNGDKKTINKLLKLIEKYPDNPQLKNYLSIAYKNNDNYKKAVEVNHWIEAEHPDYLFGKLNRAAEFYQKGEYEKIPEVLGELMEIKALYPERDLFHLAEVTGFIKIAVLYFIAVDNLEAATSRFEIMQEIAPDHPDTEFVQFEIMNANMGENLSMWDEEDKKKILVTPASNNLPKQVKEAPVFANEIINRLYDNGLYIQSELLKEILALPRKGLIADLELVLNDLLCRYEFFSQEMNDTGWEEENMNFAIHAIMLLAELRAEESLPKLLEVLRQDEDFLEFWLGDHITETIWEPIYCIGNQQMEMLKKFVQEPGVNTYAKTAVSRAVCQIFYHQPKRTEEVMQWFAQLFDFFANSVPEDNVIDSDTIGLLICDVADLKYKALLPQIKKLYEKEYVSKSITGEYEEIEKDIVKAITFQDKEELLSIENRYEQITSNWAGYTEEDMLEDSDDDFTYNDYEDIPITEPVRTDPKIGRNEPCPCGSGKKYKKCCMNKTT
ncbi:MAG: hypothetical protein DRI89_08020 [Bacteroidetes bacterium]|nr:MAG: hypothetical protein DRI89_08020 [Bacteroidota bacterium]